MQIWIDNDGCPKVIRDMVFKASARLSLPVVCVANSVMRLPASPLLRMICVEGHQDAADDYIAEHVNAGDLVITADIPLAARVVAKQAVGISTRGDIYDEASIGERLAVRNLMQELRSSGELRGGPAPLNETDKKRFASAFDRLLTALLKRRPST